jgi:hypothetical protein
MVAGYRDGHLIRKSIKTPEEAQGYSPLYLTGGVLLASANNIFFLTCTTFYNLLQPLGLLDDFYIFCAGVYYQKHSLPIQIRNTAPSKPSSNPQHAWKATRTTTTPNRVPTNPVFPYLATKNVRTINNDAYRYTR